MMARKVQERVLSTVVRWGGERECTFCGWTGLQFEPFGNTRKRRYDARCRRCGSLERHRLAHVFLRDEIEARRPATLHVAPEPMIARWLRPLSSEYLSVDLLNDAMRKEDLTRLTLPDASYDLVWCSHVLEHIPDDRAAMAEMFRVCRPGGIVVVQVPIWRETTEEDPTVIDPDERLARFFQRDHVRLYGLDIVDRLAGAGFQVDTRRTRDLDPATLLRHGLHFISTGEVFICRRPD